MTQLEFPSGMESMAACTDLNSPLPLISTLIVRLIPNLCVNKGESMTVCALVARALYGMQHKMKTRIATMNVEACKDDEEEAMSCIGVMRICS